MTDAHLPSSTTLGDDALDQVTGGQLGSEPKPQPVPAPPPPTLPTLPPPPKPIPTQPPPPEPRLRFWW